LLCSSSGYAVAKESGHLSARTCSLERELRPDRSHKGHLHNPLKTSCLPVSFSVRHVVIQSHVKIPRDPRTHVLDHCNTRAATREDSNSSIPARWCRTATLRNQSRLSTSAWSSENGFSYMTVPLQSSNAELRYGCRGLLKISFHLLSVLLMTLFRLYNLAPISAYVKILEPWMRSVFQSKSDSLPLT
jgi:hypothetical protein